MQECLSACFFARKSRATKTTKTKGDVDEGDDVALRVFPPYVVDYVRTQKMRSTADSESWRAVARTYDDVTVMFCDIVGFSPMCRDVDGMVVMGYLHAFYTMLDKALERYPSVYKVETIGDCIVCAAGLFGGDDDGHGHGHGHGHVSSPQACARDVFDFAQDAVALASTLRMPGGTARTSVRIGINTGCVTTGVVGLLMPRFTLFGNTVNAAARLQTSAKPGQVVISQATQTLLLGDLRGVGEHHAARLDLKGIGEVCVQVYEGSREMT